MPRSRNINRRRPNSRRPRRSRIPAVQRSLASPDRTYSFVREYVEPTLYQIANVAAISAYDYQLAYLPGYTEFTALFDQYRIDKVVVKLTPHYNVGFPAANVTYPRLYAAVDYSDKGVPASLNELRQYANCTITPAFKGITRTFVPKCAQALYSGVFTSYGSVSKGWVDVNSPSVQFYGLKLGLDPGEVGQTALQGYFIDVTAHVSFRNPK